MLRISTILVCLLFGSTSFASAVLTLQGSVYSLNRKSCEIQTAKKIYTLNLSALTKEQLSAVEKPNAKVEFDRGPPLEIAGVAGCEIAATIVVVLVAERLTAHPADCVAERLI